MCIRTKKLTCLQLKPTDCGAREGVDVFEFVVSVGSRERGCADERRKVGTSLSLSLSLARFHGASVWNYP